MEEKDTRRHCETFYRPCPFRNDNNRAARLNYTIPLKNGKRQTKYKPIHDPVGSDLRYI
jgi:hypothetical protein